MFNVSNIFNNVCSFASNAASAMYGYTPLAAQEKISSLFGKTKMCYEREGVVVQGDKEDTIAGYKNIAKMHREQVEQEKKQKQEIKKVLQEVANKNLETGFEYDSKTQALKLVVKGGQSIDNTVGGLARTVAKSYVAGEIYLKGAKPTYKALKQLINASGLIPGSGWAHKQVVALLAKELLPKVLPFIATAGGSLAVLALDYSLSYIIKNLLSPKSEWDPIDEVPEKYQWVKLDLDKTSNSISSDICFEIPSSKGATFILPPDDLGTAKAKSDNPEVASDSKKQNVLAKDKKQGVLAKDKKQDVLHIAQKVKQYQGKPSKNLKKSHNSNVTNGR